MNIKEICFYYGQNYDNVKYMEQYLKRLKERYENDK